jgi:hypothetical protein
MSPPEGLRAADRTEPPPGPGAGVALGKSASPQCKAVSPADGSTSARTRPTPVRGRQAGFAALVLSFEQPAHDALHDNPP